MGYVKKGKLKKSLIMKVWKRCLLSIPSLIILKPYYYDKNKNNNCNSSKKDGDELMMMAPKRGCFSVCVGPEKQRFVVKTKHANHPLFMMLLEEAELEYGFQFDGPICLPCNVDFFFKVLAEIMHCDYYCAQKQEQQEDEDEEEEDIIINKNSNNNNNKVKGYYYSFLVLLLSSKRFLCYARNNGEHHHHGPYKVMDSKMVRVNNFQC